MDMMASNILGLVRVEEREGVSCKDGKEFRSALDRKLPMLYKKTSKIAPHLRMNGYHPSVYIELRCLAS